MFYNLCQSNVNPTLPPLLVTGHNITDLRPPDITIPHTSVKELDPFSSNTISILQFLDFKIWLVICFVWCICERGVLWPAINTFIILNVLFIEIDAWNQDLTSLFFIKNHVIIFHLWNVWRRKKQWNFVSEGTLALPLYLFLLWFIYSFYLFFLSFSYFVLFHSFFLCDFFLSPHTVGDIRRPVCVPCANTLCTIKFFCLKEKKLS